MQDIVVAEKYRFVPPKESTFWPAVVARLLPRYLAANHGVVEVECRGAERLRASLAAGDGVVLAPNHCRPCDPMVVGVLAREAGCVVNIMASSHLFHGSRVLAFLLPRLGVFSVYREGKDRQALTYAARLVAEGRRPLLVFPEGAITRHNDRLNHFMDGAAAIARHAAKERGRQGSAGRVVVHPVALRYVVQGDVASAVAPALAEIEGRLTWRTRPDLPVDERVARVGAALLALKELEILGASQPGEIAERVTGLIDRLLVPLEEEWVGGARDADAVRRVKRLRAAILPGLVEGDLPEPEVERRWEHLAAGYLAQQLSCYPAGYFSPAPTPERLLETVERFEEDLTDAVPPRARLKAVVDVGEAIPVPVPDPARTRSPDGDPLMAEVRERVYEMLQASLDEARPGARMA